MLFSSSSLRAMTALILLVLPILICPASRATEINDALDNTQLTFTTAGAARWFKQESGGVDGYDFIYGSFEGYSSAMELRTTVQGPGWLTYWVHLYGSGGAVLLDGAVAQTWPQEYSGEWLQQGVALREGSQQIAWRVEPSYGTLLLDRVSVEPSASRSLDSALPGFTWTTGGTVPWTAGTFPLPRRTAQAWSQLPYSATQAAQSWIQTTLSGPGRVDWYDSGSSTIRLRLVVDGKSQPSETRWTSFLIPAGEHTVRWQHERPAGYLPGSAVTTAELSKVYYHPGVERTLSDALGAPNLTFTAGGESPWTAAQVPAFGYRLTQEVAFPGFLSPGGESWLSTTLTGPGDFQSDGALALDGVPISANSTLLIPPGLHTARWSTARPLAGSESWIYSQPFVDSVKWNPMALVSFAEALDCANVEFLSQSPLQDVHGRSSGPAPLQDEVLLRNGGALLGTLTGPGVLSWSGRGSIPVSMDGKNLGTPADRFSPPVSVIIPPGQHVMRWWATGYSGAALTTMQFVPGNPLPVGEALGSPGLVWQTSPEVSAFDSRGGMALFYLPEPVTQNRLYGLETTVTGPGVFTVKLGGPAVEMKNASGETGMGAYVDGIYQTGQQTLGNPWAVSTIRVTPGTHTLRLSPLPTSSPQPWYFTVDEASWQQEQEVSLAEALDSPQLTFTSGGGCAWYGVDGPLGDFARAGQFSSPGEAWLETLVTGPGLLTFLPFQPGSANSPWGPYPSPLDFPGFQIDGISRAVDRFTPNILEISGPGPHTLRWVASGPAAGLDAVSWREYHPQPLASWAPAAGFSLTTSDHAWAVVDGPDEDGGGSLHPTAAGGSGSQPWLEGRFTGPAMLEFSLLATAPYAEVVVSEAAISGSIYEWTSETALNWKRFQIPLPAGEHTIRWTFPASNNTSLVQPNLMWLDRLLLTPFPGTLEEAAELPAGSIQPSWGLVWYPVSEPSLPDGDAIACAAGFNSFTSSADIQLQYTGPVTVKFQAKGGAIIYVYRDYRMDTPVLARVLPPGGWSEVSFDVPPGPHTFTVVASSSTLLDRFSTSEPWQSWPAAQVVGIPGVSVTTNPDNPVVGYSSDGNLPGKVWFSNLPGRTTPWLAMQCDGPALLRFTPEFDREPLRVSDPNSISIGGSPAPLPFTLEVDGLALPFQEIPRILESVPGGYGPKTSPFAIYLPPGRHSVHWTLQPALPPAEPSSGILGGFSLTPAPPLGGTWPDQHEAMLILEHRPLTIITENGEPVLKCSQTSVQDGYGNYLRLLGWRSAQPGVLTFRWRLPEPRPWFLPPRVEYHFPGQRELWDEVNSYHPTAPLTVEWTEVTLVSPADAMNLIWSLPYEQTGFELSRLRFTPCTRVSLSEAAAVPGLTLDTPQPGAWTGLRRPDGSTIIVPPQGRSDGVNTWPNETMNSSITGPVLLKWRETQVVPPQYQARSAVFGEGRTGSSNDVSASEQAGLDAMKSGIYNELVIPSGIHQVSWKNLLLMPWIGPALDQFSLTPIPAAYADWRIQIPGAPGGLVGLAPGGDIDEDGMSNLAEYTWRTDPVAENPPVQPVAGMEGGHLTLCLPEPRPESDGVRVVIETSDDMLTWSPAATEAAPGAPPGQVKYRLLQPAAATARTYVRARAEFVPQ